MVRIIDMLFVATCQTAEVNASNRSVIHSIMTDKVHALQLEFAYLHCCRSKVLLRQSCCRYDVIVEFIMVLSFSGVA